MIPQRPLGNTGFRVSVLGYGGAPIGFQPTADRSVYLSLIQRALDLGVNFFDTAPDYRESEALLGQALHDRRADVILATKCGRIQSWNGRAWDVHEDWSERGVLETIDRSLRCLGTDYLDLVQLHSPPPWVLEDGAALRGLLKAQAAGKVRQLGLSSEGATAWRGLEPGVFATLQVSYSLLQQEAGEALLPAAAARGLGLIIKQPLANAVPLMRTRPDHPDWSWKWDVCEQLDWASFDDGNDRLTVMLRWLLANPLVNTAIVGTSRRAHLEANAAAAAAGPLGTATDRRIADAYRAAYRLVAPSERP
jgi:aryl-alcohol dehydrogenase-like predicted oxidoreductase